MASYVFLTAFLFQRGSSESKDPDKPEEVDEDPRSPRAESNAPWPVQHGSVVLSVYNHSLSLALTALFLLSFAGHAAGSFKAHNQERIAHGESVISLAEHVTSSHFLVRVVSELAERVFGSRCPGCVVNLAPREEFARIKAGIQSA